jgi:hypothetical protein
MITADLLASLSFASYIIAIVLNQLINKMYKNCRRCGREHWRFLNTQCAQPDPSSLSSNADSTPSDAISTAKAPEFPVVGSAAWRRPLITNMNNQLRILRSLLPADAEHKEASSQPDLDDNATNTRDDGASEQADDIRDTEISSPSTTSDPERDAVGAEKPVSSLMRLLGLFIWHTIIAPPNILYAMYELEDESGFREAELRIAQQEGTSDRPATTTHRAEESSAAATTGSPSSPSQGSGLVLKQHLQPYCYVLYKLIHLALKQTATLIVRSLMIIGTLSFYEFEWVEWKVMRFYPPKLLMMAFGFVNFFTFASCYLIFFDSTGTSAPGWADVFG